MAVSQSVKALWQQPNRRNWLYITLACLLGLSVAGYKAHTRWLPDIAEYIAEVIPREIYQAIGETTLESLDREDFKPSEISAARQAQITQEFDFLIEQLALDKDNYQLHFRDWNGGINAFALMNGAVVITDDLLEALQQPLQVNAVLLHEIGHIKHNHLMKNTIRVSIFYITMLLIFGDISAVADLLVETSVAGMSFSFSRQYELEADAYAARSMQQLYNTIEPAIKAFEALAAADHTEAENAAEDSVFKQWLSTHPPTATRIDYMREVVSS